MNYSKKSSLNWVIKIFIAIVGVSAGGATNVAASEAALLEILRNNKLITDAQYATLTKASAAPSVPQADQDVLDVLLANGLITQAQFAALRVKSGQEKMTNPEAKAALKEGFKVQTQDKTFTAQVGAYFQADTASYGDDETDLSSGTELRRGRLSLSGTLLTDWDYKLEADFAGTTQSTGTTNTVTATDAYLRWNGLRPWAFTAGNFKVPFGLEAVSSGKYLTFTERGLPFAFLTLRRLGGMVATNGANWTASLGGFGDAVTSQNDDDEGYQAAGRITFAPWFEADRALHFGLSGSWVAPRQNGLGGRRETIAFRAKPETNIASDALVANTASIRRGRTFGNSSGRLVDTGNIPGGVNYVALGGAELAAVYGPWSLQGEYIHTEVDRDQFGDLAFEGYYVYGSWFITGESRNYRGDKGVFDTLVPSKNFDPRYFGWGAWELAARYSGLDLNDGTVEGGDIEEVTIGINWYPNAYVRLMANYVNVLGVTGGAHDGDNPDLFQLRLQLAY
jgi:phosphate-selective porin OprO and OprP